MDISRLKVLAGVSKKQKKITKGSFNNHHKVKKGILNELIKDNILEEYIENNPDLKKQAKKVEIKESFNNSKYDKTESEFLQRIGQISKETIEQDKKINSNKYPNYQNVYNIENSVNENKKSENQMDPISSLLSKKHPIDYEIENSINEFKKLTEINEDETENKEVEVTDNMDKEGNVKDEKQEKEMDNTEEEPSTEETEKQDKQPKKKTDKNINQIIKAVSKLADYINWDEDSTEDNIKKLADKINRDLNKDEPSKNNLSALALLLSSASLIDDQELQQVILSNFKKYIVGNKEIEQFAENIKALKVEEDYEGETVIPDEEENVEKEENGDENSDEEEIDFDNTDYEEKNTEDTEEK